MVGNCVGKHNYRHFVTFLVAATISMCFVLVGTIAQLVLVFKEYAASNNRSSSGSSYSTSFSSSDNDSILSIILLILKHLDVFFVLIAAFFTAMQAGSLGFAHLGFVFMGMTTNEWVCSTDTETTSYVCHISVLMLLLLSVTDKEVESCRILQQTTTQVSAVSWLLRVTVSFSDIIWY